MSFFWKILTGVVRLTDVIPHCLFQNRGVVSGLIYFKRENITWATEICCCHKLPSEYTSMWWINEKNVIGQLTVQSPTWKIKLCKEVSVHDGRGIQVILCGWRRASNVLFHGGRLEEEVGETGQNQNLSVPGKARCQCSSWVMHISIFHAYILTYGIFTKILCNDDGSFRTSYIMYLTLLNYEFEC